MSYLAGNATPALEIVTNSCSTAPLLWLYDRVVWIFLDREQALIAEFPRHLLGRLENVARRV